MLESHEYKLLSRVGEQCVSVCEKMRRKQTYESLSDVNDVRFWEDTLIIIT